MRGPFGNSIDAGRLVTASVWRGRQARFCFLKMGERTLAFILRDESPKTYHLVNRQDSSETSSRASGIF